jgi:hypothetical protein
MTITKRLDKGVALTYGELDENFRDLDSDMTLDRVLKNGDSSNRDLVLTGTATLTTPNLAADSAYFSNLSYASLNGLASGDYLPGQTIQEHWYRFSDSEHDEVIIANDPVIKAQDRTDFGNRILLWEPTDVEITLVKDNSLVVIEWNIVGEPSNHNSGFLIAEDSSDGGPRVIRREGYEGYNTNTLVNFQVTGDADYARNNCYISVFYDANNESTMRQTVIRYFDKPGVSGYKRYRLLYKNTANSSSRFRMNRSYANPGTAAGYETSISNVQIREIAQ